MAERPKISVDIASAIEANLRKRLAAVEEQRDNLVAAVEDVIPTLAYYIGPDSRTATGKESNDRYHRVRFAFAVAKGKECPYCRDSGLDERYSWNRPYPCQFGEHHLHAAATREYRQAVADKAEREARPDSKAATR